ncbi:MAG: hypothetical protein CM1200mP12_05000 [Gammaproteobacteria bacterium]|nr:MAG: hypothetical protein CM1200mP12_05000 [Gammaproteobacteria bacterium]
MTIQVGDKLPQITVSTMTDEGPKPVSMEELVQGKKGVLFAGFPGIYAKPAGSTSTWFFTNGGPKR